LKESRYTCWAKYSADARYNLAVSGVLSCGPADLRVNAPDIELNGDNLDGFPPLVEAIAAKYGVSSESVVTAQGTSMANFLACATVLERGNEVLIEHPAYDPLLAIAGYLGAEVKRFHRRFENGYEIDTDELSRLVSSRTRLLMITSPHNPSGVVVSESALQQIAQIAERTGTYVLMDEVYRDALFELAPPVSATLSRWFIVTSSLTKSYGLGGLRCGWIICEPELAGRMRRMNDLFGSYGSMPSETLGLVAFRQLGALERRTKAILAPNTEIAHAFLSSHTDVLDCVVPPRSLTVFPQLRREEDSQVLHDRLRKLETSIVPGAFFESPRHFRLGFTVATEDVREGLNRLSLALRMTS
jgi:aspartate/methionine/tyrosine aminotransferase